MHLSHDSDSSVLGTYRQPDRQTDGQTERWMDGWTDRQPYR